jgi:isopenicillin N synthase-like dioxygenase
VEFINVAKDDALAYPKVVRRSYPSTVNARMDNTIRPFVRKSMDVNNTLLEVFGDRLGLPKGTLANLHQVEAHSGSETRVIKNPANMENKGQLIGSHTDFGTLVRLLGAFSDVF